MTIKKVSVSVGSNSGCYGSSTNAKSKSYQWVCAIKGQTLLVLTIGGDPTSTHLDIYLGGRFDTHEEFLAELDRLKTRLTHREDSAVLAALGYQDIFAGRIAQTIAEPLNTNQAITFIGPDTSLSRRTYRHFTKRHPRTLTTSRLSRE